MDIKTSVKHKLTLLPEVALGLIPEGLAGRVERARAPPRLLTVALLRAESPETATRSTGDPLATWVLVRSRRHQSRLFQRREVRLRCPEAHLVSRMFPDRSSWASCGGSPAPCYCESGVWESRLVRPGPALYSTSARKEKPWLLRIVSMLVAMVRRDSGSGAGTGTEEENCTHSKRPIGSAYRP